MGKRPLFNRPAGGGTIFSVAGANMTTGDIWFVDSTHAEATDAVTHGHTPDAPFATLEYAITNGATADKGDVIYIMPDHSETATTAIELFDLDKAAVSVIGLGEGFKRPAFKLGHVDATVKMAAAGCRISNIRIMSTLADIKTGLEITVGGSVVDNCYFGGTTSKEFLITIAVSADADELVIQGNHIVAVPGDEGTSCINFAGGSDHTIIKDNMLLGDWTTDSAIDASTAASVNLVILNNYIVNNDDTTGLCYKGHGSSTGFIGGNFMAGAVNNTQTNNTVTKMHCSETYGNDAANTTGILTPAAGTI